MSDVERWHELVRQVGKPEAYRLTWRFEEFSAPALWSTLPAGERRLFGFAARAWIDRMCEEVAHGRPIA